MMCIEDSHRRQRESVWGWQALTETELDIWIWQILNAISHSFFRVINLKHIICDRLSTTRAYDEIISLTAR